MEPEKEMNEQESLQLINRMIHSAQKGVNDNGFYFLLWGWFVFVASVSNYLLVEVFPTNYNWIPWAVLMPLGGIISGIYGWKVERRKKVKTYADDMLNYVHIAFCVCLFITLFFMSQVGGKSAQDPNAGWHYAYPVIMMIYGSWLFICGGAIRFKPLMIGGVIDWGCAVAGLFIHTTELILVLSFAVLAGYIIPGHLLKAKYNKEKRDAAI